MSGETESVLKSLPAEKLCNKWGEGNPINGDGPLGNKKKEKMHYIGSDREELVKTVQMMLKTLGYDLGTSGPDENGIDGYFGDTTEEFVIDFQRKNKDWDGDALKEEGLIGPRTADALNRVMVEKQYDGQEWYNHYQTPKELVEGKPYHTVTTDFLADYLSIKPSNAKEGKVFVFGLNTAHDKKRVQQEPRCGAPSAALEASRRFFQSNRQQETLHINFEVNSKTVQPKLCLYQDGDESTELFLCQANRWAKRISAVKIEPYNNNPKIGATPYKNGSEIKVALFNAVACLGHLLKEVHIFGHMFEEGIIGSRPEFVGLYRDKTVHYRSRGDKNEYKVELDDQWPNLRASPTQMGARIVKDIWTDFMDEDIVFILHGCNTANTNPRWVVNDQRENFAHVLFKHLADNLGNPKVYGHHISVCAGHDSYWRIYSFKWENNQQTEVVKDIRGSEGTYYSGNGCCP